MTDCYCLVSRISSLLFVWGCGCGWGVGDVDLAVGSKSSHSWSATCMLLNHEPLSSFCFVYKLQSVKNHPISLFALCDFGSQWFFLLWLFYLPLCSQKFIFNKYNAAINFQELNQAMKILKIQCNIVYFKPIHIKSLCLLFFFGCGGGKENVKLILHWCDLLHFRFLIMAFVFRFTKIEYNAETVLGTSLEKLIMKHPIFREHSNFCYQLRERNNWIFSKLLYQGKKNTLFYINWSMILSGAFAVHRIRSWWLWARWED